METISHEGIVKAVNGNEIMVSLYKASSCGQCQIKDSCSGSECRVTTISVFSTQAAQYHIGQKVRVSINEKAGWVALGIGYLMPLSVLMAVLLCCMAVSGDETLSALFGLGSLALYYIGLAFCKTHISKYFKFTISPE